MREQVERLEDDADSASDVVRVDAASRDVVTVEQDLPGIDWIEQVDTTQQGRLSAAAGADQTHDLVLVDGEVDAVEHGLVAVGLVHTSQFELWSIGHHTCAWDRSWRSRAVYQSTKRVSGMLIARKSRVATR